MFSSSVPRPKSKTVPIRIIWLRNPVKPSSAPIATAVVGSTPLRWKNRMLTATRAAVAGMARLTKLNASCNKVSRLSGTRVGARPDRATALAKRADIETKKANDHEGEAGLAEGLGDGVEADVGEAGHERRTGDEQQHSHQHATPGETAKLLKISAFDASGLHGRGAESVDVEVSGGGVSPKAARQRSWLHVRRRVGETFGSQRGQRSGHRPLRSERDGGHDEDLGPIDLERTRERLDPGRRQVGECHRVTVDEHPLGIDRSMRDARAVERPEGSPHRLTEPLVDLRAELGERPPDTTSHEEGVADRIGTGCHDRVNRSSSTFCEQRQECLVLHLLQPRHREGRPAVAVPDEPPQRDEQLPIPGVPAVDLHVELGAGRVASTDVHDTVAPCDVERLRLDADPGEGRLGLGHRRKSAG